MRIRRPGFALIIVLIASSGVFALAMQGAVLMRTSTMETRVLADRASMERDARAAAVVALQRVTGKGLVAPGGAASDPLAGSAGGAGDRPRDEVELPEIVRALLEAAGKEIEDGARQEVEADEELRAAAEAGGLASGAARVTGSDREVSPPLPAGPVDVRFSEDGPTYRVMLTDAAGQLNLNETGEDQLRRYFVALGEDAYTADRLAQELIDWRDEDSFTHPLGAEQPLYTLRGIRCRNAPIRSVEELGYLPSFTPALIDRMRADVSLAGDGKIHVPTASRAVLASIEGLRATDIEKILAARATGPIDADTLESLLPGLSSETRATVRADASGLVRIEVSVVDGPDRRYEGLGVVRGGVIDSLALRPM